ncbi:hypothetical protein [Agrobacterium vitis]
MKNDPIFREAGRRRIYVVHDFPSGLTDAAIEDWLYDFGAVVTPTDVHHTVNFQYYKMPYTGDAAGAVNQLNNIMPVGTLLLNGSGFDAGFKAQNYSTMTATPLKTILEDLVAAHP